MPGKQFVPTFILYLVSINLRANDFFVREIFYVLENIFFPGNFLSGPVQFSVINILLRYGLYYTNLTGGTVV